MDEDQEDEIPLEPVQINISNIKKLSRNVINWTNIEQTSGNNKTLKLVLPDLSQI